MSVYQCCFIVPRLEIDVIGFTVMWNKAIGKKLKACQGFQAQNQLSGAHLSAGLLPCTSEAASSLSCSALSSGQGGSRLRAEEVRGSQGKVANLNAGEGTRFGLMGKTLKI